MTPKKFVKHLAELQMDLCFNPYSDTCPVYDKKNAYKFRRELLEKMLEAASKTEVDAIWVGRDLGYKGGRRTGLALTDEVNACVYAQRWGVTAEQFTIGNLCRERTATIIWSVLQSIELPVFLWNVFPLHPYVSGSLFSNRAHNARERKVGESILFELCDMLNPKKIIAIGNDAHDSSMRINSKIECYKVRHPSYGGHNEFIEQVSAIYGIGLSNKQGSLF